MEKSLKPIFIFLAKLAAFYGLASYLYNEFVVLSPAALNPFLDLITGQSVQLLSWVGYDAGYAHIEAGFAIFIDSILSVFVNEGCSGGSLYILFFSLIFAFGGPFKHMLWFVPISLGAVYFLNLWRIVYLSIIEMNYPEYFKFNHDYVVVVVLYGFMFLLWYIWINYFAVEENQPTTSSK